MRHVESEKERDREREREEEREKERQSEREKIIRIKHEATLMARLDFSQCFRG